MCPGPVSKKVQVFDKLTLDLNSDRNEYHFRTPFFSDYFMPMLKDPRDWPMIHLMLNIVMVMAPSLLLVYAVHIWECSALTRNLLGAVHVLVLGVGFLERFMLMMHYSSHRSLFKNPQLNGILVWCFSPFLGVPPGMYHLQHVIMHHIENNHALDISATEDYQRDSPFAFARYWFHFVFLIWFELPLYCLKSKRYEWLGTSVTGLGMYFVGIWCMASFVNFGATMWVFVVPYFIVMTALSFGNYSQHIFVDPDNNLSNYHLTYNCIDHFTNKTTFNDGYHVIHHANARLHWSELPEQFLKTLGKHRDMGSLTFRNIHFFEVGIMVMTGQLRKLAERHYVHLGTEESAPTVDEVEAKLRNWLRPVSPDESSKKKV
jgi:fatty acid desaturase